MTTPQPSPRPVRTAVFPVAGFGTRVLPATKSVPKEMLPVVDRPVIDWVVREAREAGITRFVFVTGRGKSAIENYFDHAVELEAALEAKGKTDILHTVDSTRLEPGQAVFVRQQRALGLGHAVGCAAHVVGDEPFAVILPDMLVLGEPGCLAQMMGSYRPGGNVIAVHNVPEDQVSLYGVVEPAPGEDPSHGTFRMRGMVEKPARADAPSTLAITGRYIFQPDIFRLLESEPRGQGGEIQLTGAMARLMEEQPFTACAFQGTVHDTGNKLGYFEAFLSHALADPVLGEAARALIAERAG